MSDERPDYGFDRPIKDFRPEEPKKKYSPCDDCKQTGCALHPKWRDD